LTSISFSNSRKFCGVIVVDQSIDPSASKAGRIPYLVAAFLALLVLGSPAAAAQAPGGRSGLTLDDVLAFTRIDHATLSPDGRSIAVVVQRAAGPGEVFGRTSLDLDPGRADVWLVPRAGGTPRNLTGGASSAAGFWCATWSPDGRRLAMLSTRPEGREPRGGDNVRLYVWDDRTGRLSRLSAAPVMTQTRSSLNRLDLRGGGTAANRCHGYENAPFLWLDNHRLLALTLAPGTVSGLIDEFARPLRRAEDTLADLREGQRPTGSAVQSGGEAADVSSEARITIFDLTNGGMQIVGTIPTYPFRGELTLSVAPDGRRAAIMATRGAIPPAAGRPRPAGGDSWSVRKALGFVELAPNATPRWLSMPDAARYPLQLYGWSPDSARIAFRARGAPEATATPLFAATVDGTVSQLGEGRLTVGGAAAGSEGGQELPVLWVNARELLARASPADPAARADWWLLPLEGASVNVTAGGPPPPEALRRSIDGTYYGLSEGRLMRLDQAGRRMVPSAGEPGLGDEIAGPSEPDRETASIVVSAAASDRSRRLRAVPLAGGAPPSAEIVLQPGEELIEASAAQGLVIAQEAGRDGLFLRETSLVDGTRRTLLALNRHLAGRNWGETRLFDYRTAAGQSLKAALILPPDYQPGRRYPVITWVYPGSRVRDLYSYFLQPQMGGFYNLQLYAARGYLVLIPSIPLDRRAAAPDLLTQTADAVLPALDRLVELGIADNDRLGVLGQSFGGFGVYALVARTNRFRAAVAIAGITDLAAFYTEFDRGARDYPGIEHEKSYNWSIAEQFGRTVPPFQDRGGYAQSSPLSQVERVETPLLMLHGELDSRAPVSQAESFFFSLYQLGRPARLVRYWGENHGLSLSPANIRSVFEETNSWFDRYLRR
jgi:dipeptidyl aminopeptidase/acylaminoacyl peptidase